MAQTDIKKRINQEIDQYSKYLDQVLQAFTKESNKILTQYTSKFEIATLAGDKDSQERVLKDFKNVLAGIKDQLKEHLEVNDKRFLKHVETMVSRFEQKNTLLELDQELKQA